MVLTATFLSCKEEEEDNTVKLLQSVSEDSSFSSYEYDSQNRLTKISRRIGEQFFTETLIYSKYDLFKFGDFNLTPTASNQLTYSDGSITYTFDLNSDGTLAKSSYNANGRNYEIKYEYQNGNLAKITEEGFFDGESLGSGATEFTYDSMNSPFLNCKTSRWWLIWSFGGDIGVTKNNVTGWTYVSDEESSGAVLSYEYDDEGYPTKREWNDSGFFVYYSYNK